MNHVICLFDMKKKEKLKTYETYEEEFSDIVQEFQIPLYFRSEGEQYDANTIKVLSLFSGCGGMDLGFEGDFIAPRLSYKEKDPNISDELFGDWVMVKKTRFKTIFANDILTEAKVAWTTHMRKFGYDSEIFHSNSIVELVKMQQSGIDVFPADVDVVTGGFPCQDFSVAGKRKGFDSEKDDYGKNREDKPTEESRGKLYYWMKQVIDIVKPKMFIAENVKGLVNLGDVKDIIQQDFSRSDGNGYIVLTPQVLHAGDYGVPETRERVIFIGIRRDALLPDARLALESEDIPSEYNPYPKPTHSYTQKGRRLLKPVTTYDVLKDLPEPKESKDLSQKIYSKAKFLSNGSQGQVEIKLDGLGPTIRSEHHGNIEFRRLSAEHGGKHIEELKQGLEERRLTPRECALIQTFPPDFKFVMKNENGKGMKLSSSGAYKVIGNAVPPVLANKIATRLQELWPKYFG